MSTTTLSDKKQSSMITLTDVLGTESTFSFLYKDAKVPTSKFLESMQSKQKIQKRIDEEKEFLEQFSRSVPSFWQKMTHLFTLSPSSPSIVSNNTSLIPNETKIRNYKGVQNYGQIVSTLKQLNDYALFFERSYNALIAEDVRNSQSLKRNEMLMSKKLRSLKVLFDEIETNSMKENSLFNYYHSESHMYKVVKFVTGTLVYESAKQMVCQYVLDKTNLQTYLGPFAYAPVYLVFNFYTVYKNLSSDEREDQSTLEKIKYALIKGGFTVIIDVLKMTLFPMLGFSSVFVILGTTVVEAVLMMFDPKADKQRSDELAKSYGEMTLDKEFIKHVLQPAKSLDVTKKILSGLKLPFDWIATLPEAVGQAVFGNVYIPYLSTILKYCNTTYKCSVYAIGSVSCFCMVSTVLANYTPFGELYQHAYTLAVQHGLWNDNIILSLTSGITNRFLSETQKSVLQLMLQVFTGLFGLFVQFVKQLEIEKGMAVFLKNSFLYMCEHHKEFVRFISNTMFAATIAPHIRSFLKANTQHYLAFACPILFQMMTVNPSASTDDYAQALTKSVFNGGIAVLLSVGVNITTTFIQGVKTPGLQQKIKFALGNSLFFSYLDGVAKSIQDEYFGSFRDYLEVKFGRKTMFDNLNVSNFTNLVVVTAYFEPKLQQAVSDMISNSEILKRMMDDADANSETFSTSIEKEKINKVLARQRVKDQTEKSKLQHLLQDPHLDIEKRNRTLGKLAAFDAMQDFYTHVENVTANPTFEFKQAAKASVIKSVLFNNFNPFLKPINEMHLRALENDYKVQIANFTNFYTSRYGQKLQLLEERKRFLLSNSTQQDSKFQRDVENLNSSFTELKMEFQGDAELTETSTYLQTLTDVVLNEYDLTSTKNTTSIFSYYTRSTRLQGIREALEQMSAVSKGNVHAFDKDVFVSADDITHTGVSDAKSFLEKFIKPFLEPSVVEVRSKSDENITMTEKEAESLSVFGQMKGFLYSPWEYTKLFLQEKFQSMFLDFVLTSCKKSTQIFLLRLKNAKKTMAELEQLKLDAMKNTNLSAEDRNVLIETLSRAMTAEFDTLNTLQSMTIGIFEKADSVLPIFTRGGKDEHFSAASKIKSALASLKATQKDFATATDVDIETSLETDVMTMFDAPPSLSPDAQLPYTGDEIQTLSAINSVAPYLSGRKLQVKSSGLDKMACADDSCKLYNLFIDSLRKEDLQTLANVQETITQSLLTLPSNLDEDKIREFSKGQLLLAYFNEDTKAILSKIKVTAEQKQALRDIFFKSNNYQNRGRYFTQHFEKEDNLTWANPFLLYFFSAKQYSATAIEEILRENNFRDYAQRVKELQLDSTITEAQNSERLLMEELEKFEIHVAVKQEKIEAKVENKEEEVPKPKSAFSLFSSVFALVTDFAAKVPVLLTEYTASTLHATGLFPNAVAEKMAKIQLRLQGYQEQRNVQEIDTILSKQIDQVTDATAQTQLLELKARWLMKANEVDKLIQQRETEKLKFCYAWRGDIQSYGYMFTNFGFSFYDFSGIVSPNINQLFNLFFADDANDLKRFFILSPFNGDPSIKQLVNDMYFVKNKDM